MSILDEVNKDFHIMLDKFNIGNNKENHVTLALTKAEASSLVASRVTAVESALTSLKPSLTGDTKVVGTEVHTLWQEAHAKLTEIIDYLDSLL
jgi:hypothetical protein